MSLVGYRVRLARNYADLPFPHRAQERDATAVAERVEQALKESPVPLTSLAPDERERLLEKRKISKELARSRYGYVLDLDDIVIMINEEDHLRIQVFAERNLEAAFYRAHDISNQLESVGEFARHQKWGYLATCVTNVGSGCRFSALLHLPVTMLGQDIVGTLFGKLGDQIMTRGTFGEKSDVLGNLYQASTKDMMADPAAVMKNFEARILDLLRFNGEVLDKLSSQKVSPEIYLAAKDTVMRSYGILRYAQRLEYREAMEFLSHVALGLRMNIIPTPMFTERDIFSLFSEIGRGHLSAQDTKVSIAEKRASLVRRRLFGE